MTQAGPSTNHPAARVVVSLLLGIASVLLGAYVAYFFVGFFFLPAAVGFVLTLPMGIVALRLSSPLYDKPRRLRIGAFVVGIVAVVVPVIATVAVIIGCIRQHNC